MRKAFLCAVLPGVFILTCIYSNLCAQELKPRSGSSIGIDNVIIGIVSPNNDIWLGSSTDGCAHFIEATSTWKFFNKDSARTNLKSNKLTGIETFNNNKTICATNNGAVVTSTGTWPELTEFIGLEVLATASKSDTAWLVTSNKLIRYKYDGTSNFNLELNKTIVFPGTVSAITKSGSNCGGFWGGTSTSGCFYVEKDTISKVLTTSSPKSLIDNRVNAIAAESNCSNTFVGTTGGFSVCPTDLTTACQNYTTSNGLPQNHIVEVVMGCGGNVWLATKDSGIVVYNISSQQFTRVSKFNGLTDNKITALTIAANCNAFAFTADRNINVIDSGKNVVKIINHIQETLKDQYVVSLYPNPTRDILHFDFNKSFKNIEIQIFDVTGKLIINKIDKNTNSQRIDLQHMPSGIYLYNIITDDAKIKSGKFSLQ